MPSGDVLITIPSSGNVAYSVKVGVCGHFKRCSKGEGFRVTTFVPNPNREGKAERCSDIPEHYDLIIYAANISTKSNQTTVRIERQQPMGANRPHYLNSVPTVFVE